ncbi:MAG: hypothetical protein M4D80_23860 [Myxococcota bacterium]|nr:hypothetical protein [Myxococcota bacterium]
MYSHAQRERREGVPEALRENVAGRSTRTEALEEAPSLVWEDIDPKEHAQEEIETDDSDVVAALDAPDGEREEPLAGEEEEGEPPIAMAAAMPSTAVAVGAGAGAGRHDRPHERRVQHATGHDAPQNKYNRGGVRSNRAGNNQQIARPGLRVGGKDEFHLRGDYAYRYQIVNGTKAVPVDKIWEKDLQRGADTDKRRLALNPSAPRQLVIEGERVWCVMSWSGDQSAAWIAIKDLRGDFGAIKDKASKISKAWNPKDVGAAKRASAREMKFRAVGDPIATADRIDDGRYIVPGQRGKNGNEVGDYLTKEVIRRERPSGGGNAARESKRLEQKHGGKIDLENGKRELISIVGNLPHDKTPPVAIDVARPGVDSFFVPQGKTFRREISLYKRRQRTATLRQTWVFGYVGRDQGTRKVPDKNRRGWVPLRVLARP